MAENKDYSAYILPVGALLLIGAVAQKFGLIPSQESKQAEANAGALAKFKPWARSFAEDWIKANGTKGNKYAITLLTTAKAELIAQQLKKAKGVFNDDETAVVSVFRYLKTQTQLSQVAKVFYSLYKTELFTFLESFLNEKELSKLYEIAQGLPVGITRVK